MRIISTIFIFFSIPFTASAAVSPYYSAVLDMKAILDDKNIASVFQPVPITSIENIDGNTYRVTADHGFRGCRAYVEVIYIPLPAPDVGEPNRMIRLNSNACWTSSEPTPSP